MATRSASTKSLGTVLVVGGCGFLGSNAVDQLLNFPSEDSDASAVAPSANGGTIHQADYTFPTLRSRYPSYADTAVHVLDLRCTHNRFSGATYHDGDITDPAAVLEVFKKVRPDVVINTASPTLFAPVPVLRKVNIEGTRALLEVAGGVHGDWGGRCKAFVHTSSSSVVSNTIDDLVNADERWPLVIRNPMEPYSETKALAEIIALDFNRKHNDMLTCCIRPAGIVGEKDRSGWSHAVLKSGSACAAWQLHVQLGHNDNLFDNTYVGNVVLAHLLAAECLLETHSRLEKRRAAPLDHERVDGEVFIVTNDEPAYFWDSVRYVWTLYGRTIHQNHIWSIPKGLGFLMGGLAELSAWITGRQTKMTRQTVRYGCMTKYFSCAKLKERVGYVPVVPLEEGMRRAVKSFVVDERAEKAKQGMEKKAQ